MSMSKAQKKWHKDEENKKRKYEYLKKWRKKNRDKYNTQQREQYAKRKKLSQT